MKSLSRLEPDFVVAVTPYYLAVRQDDIKYHFRMIAREAPAPLIMYNIPGNTHNPMALEAIVDLAIRPPTRAGSKAFAAGLGNGNDR